MFSSQPLGQTPPLIFTICSMYSPGPLPHLFTLQWRNALLSLEVWSKNYLKTVKEQGHDRLKISQNWPWRPSPPPLAVKISSSTPCMVSFPNVFFSNMHGFLPKIMGPDSCRNKQSFQKYTYFHFHLYIMFLPISQTFTSPFRLPYTFWANQSDA